MTRLAFHPEKAEFSGCVTVRQQDPPENKRGKGEELRPHDPASSCSGQAEHRDNGGGGLTDGPSQHTHSAKADVDDPGDERRGAAPPTGAAFISYEFSHFPEDAAVRQGFRRWARLVADLNSTPQRWPSTTGIDATEILAALQGEPCMSWPACLYDKRAAVFHGIPSGDARWRLFRPNA